MSKRPRKPAVSVAKPPESDRQGRDGSPTSVPERIRPWLLAATVAVLVAWPLAPCEGVAETGEGVPLVMLNLVLAVFWLGSLAWRNGGREGDSPLFAARRGKPSATRETGQSPSRPAIAPGPRVRFGPTDAAVLALVVLHSLSAVWAARHGHARPALNMLWLWIGLITGFFLLRQLLWRAREARAVAAVMIALGVVLAADGLWQCAWEFPRLRAEYARDPDAVLRQSGLWYPPDSPLRQQFENRLRGREPLATFALTNSLAGYLVPWLVVALGIGLGAVRGAIGSGSARTGAAAALVALPLLACLLLTKSRSAYVALTFVVVLTVLAGRGKSAVAKLGWKLPAVATIVVALLVVAAAVTGGLDREVLTEASKSLGYRLEYWRSTAAMIRDHPVLGCGPGQFQDTYTAYKLPEASEEVADPHNFLLEVWATAGTPAALALLAVLGSFGWSLARGSTLGATAGLSSSAEDAAGQANHGTAENGPVTLTGPDATAWILGGGAAGVLASWPLGLLGTTPPGLAVFWLGLPAGVASVWLLRGWIARGHLPAAVAAIALAALLVNLLAAGGIGFAGVAGSFWTLLGLGLFAVEGGRGRLVVRHSSSVGLGATGCSSASAGNTGRQAARGTRQIKCVGLLVSRAAFATAGAAVFVLAVLCYLSGYRPVLAAQRHFEAALADPSRAESHFRAVAQADPAWAEPWDQLATLAFAQWQRTGQTSDLDRFETSAAEALRLSPRSAPAWMATADRLVEAFEQSGRSELLDRAIAAYGRAVELYPTSATYRAKLALAYLAQGDRENFDRQKSAALTLDARTPHEDKRIPPKLRDRLMRSASGA